MLGKTPRTALAVGATLMPLEVLTAAVDKTVIPRGIAVTAWVVAVTQVTAVLTLAVAPLVTAVFPQQTVVAAVLI
jgi:hypothetical protein